jgi:hypothetical protein
MKKKPAMDEQEHLQRMAEQTKIAGEAMAKMKAALMASVPTYQSSSTPVVRPLGPTPPQRVNRVEEILEDLPGWDYVMALAMAQYEVGRIDQANFLLDYATELREMDRQHEARFEAIRRKETDAG